MPVIGFTGYAGAGKTTCAKLLDEYLFRSATQPETRVMSFADPLRTALRAVFNYLPESAFSANKQNPALITDARTWTGRELLQHVGTECFRAIDPDVWIHNMRARIE